MNGDMYIIAFGIAQIVFSQIPDFDQLWWLSIVAAIMSFTYSTIGLGFGIVQTIGMIGLKNLWVANIDLYCTFLLCAS